MSISADETQEIVSYLEEVKKVLTNKNDEQRDILDKRLDAVFDKLYPEYNMRLKDCYSLAETRYREFRDSIDRTPASLPKLTFADESKEKKKIGQTEISHQCLTITQKGRKSWGRVIGESAIWLVVATFLP